MVFPRTGVLALLGIVTPFVASAAYTVVINNPIPSYGTLPAFIQMLLTLFMFIMTPVLVLAVVYTGFLFVTAQGNEKSLGDAKKALVWTLAGAVIVLGAKVIAEMIRGTMSVF